GSELDRRHRKPSDFHLNRSLCTRWEIERAAYDSGRDTKADIQVGEGWKLDYVDVVGVIHRAGFISCAGKTVDRGTHRRVLGRVDLCHAEPILPDTRGSPPDAVIVENFEIRRDAVDLLAV